MFQLIRYIPFPFSGMGIRMIKGSKKNSRSERKRPVRSHLKKSWK
ncbi:hypothetical protein LEP1GSC145_0729 [Leptospira interrogans serovar Djasiman str. LT1649]|uniref:Uncharacterized protein n=2 Tax=Leptospira interrogans TaxID=173 RepID=A0A0F6HFV4_LEPIR|nr:hypothetical protein LEP1GSC104_2079 [Leptospira interrogans str. UI 12621]EMG21592.1 hypothetical protein LEP1GSC150_1433 [Leptospira interrogans serovar Copenhageni str. LT2050]EMM91641.1 hypothetical protein LEP1GSC145_0729 [Leptospira interrogans serovar Djasiman str. LT1649]